MADAFCVICTDPCPGGRGALVGCCGQASAPGDENNCICHECLHAYVVKTLFPNGRDSRMTGVCPRIACPFHPKNTLVQATWKDHVPPEVSAAQKEMAAQTLSFQCGGCHSRKSLYRDDPADFDRSAFAPSVSGAKSHILEYAAGRTVPAALLDAMGASEGLDLLELLPHVADPERRAALHLAYLRRFPSFDTFCCRVRHCFRCRVHRGHPGMTCAEYQASRPVSDVLSCANCGVFLVKGDGCSSVTCVCGTSFSWPERLRQVQAERLALARQHFARAFDEGGGAGDRVAFAAALLHSFEPFDAANAEEICIDLQTAQLQSSAPPISRWPLAREGDRILCEGAAAELGDPSNAAAADEAFARRFEDRMKRRGVAVAAAACPKALRVAAYEAGRRYGLLREARSFRRLPRTRAAVEAFEHSRFVWALVERLRLESASSPALPTPPEALFQRLYPDAPAAPGGGVLRAAGVPLPALAAAPPRGEGSSKPLRVRSSVSAAVQLLHEGLPPRCLEVPPAAFGLRCAQRLLPEAEQREAARRYLQTGATAEEVRRCAALRLERGSSAALWGAHGGAEEALSHCLLLDMGFPPGGPAGEGGRAMRACAKLCAVRDGLCGATDGGLSLVPLLREAADAALSAGAEVPPADDALFSAALEAVDAFFRGGEGGAAAEESATAFAEESLADIGEGAHGDLQRRWVHLWALRRGHEALAELTDPTALLWLGGMGSFDGLFEDEIAEEEHFHVRPRRSDAIAGGSGRMAGARSQPGRLAQASWDSLREAATRDFRARRSQAQIARRTTLSTVSERVREVEDLIQRAAEARGGAGGEPAAGDGLEHFLGGGDGGSDGSGMSSGGLELEEPEEAVLREDEEEEESDSDDDIMFDLFD